MVVSEYTFHYEMHVQEYLHRLNGGLDTEIVSTELKQVMLSPTPTRPDVPSPPG
jgi:hypothetical protein